MTSSVNDVPSKDYVQKLLNYLDILYPNGEPIDPQKVPNNPGYKDEVEDFIRLVQIWLPTYDFDVVAMYKMAQDPAKIATANWTEIRQMLYSISRAERLSLYQYGRAIEYGRIRHILLRIKQLAEQ